MNGVNQIAFARAAVQIVTGKMTQKLAAVKGLNHNDYRASTPNVPAAD